MTKHAKNKSKSKAAAFGKTMLVLFIISLVVLAIIALNYVLFTFADLEFLKEHTADRVEINEDTVPVLQRFLLFALIITAGISVALFSLWLIARGAIKRENASHLKYAYSDGAKRAKMLFIPLGPILFAGGFALHYWMLSETEYEHSDSIFKILFQTPVFRSDWRYFVGFAVMALGLVLFIVGIFIKNRKGTQELLGAEDGIEVEGSLIHISDFSNGVPAIYTFCHNVGFTHFVSCNNGRLTMRTDLSPKQIEDNWRQIVRYRNGHKDARLPKGYSDSDLVYYRDVKTSMGVRVAQRTELAREHTKDNVTYKVNSTTGAKSEVSRSAVYETVTHAYLDTYEKFHHVCYYYLTATDEELQDENGNPVVLYYDDEVCIESRRI